MALLHFAALMAILQLEASLMIPADIGFSLTTPQKRVNKRTEDETSQSCYPKQPTCPQICLHL